MAAATTRLHLDGYDQTALFSGKSDSSRADFVFYYDETVLTAIRYKQFKITFSAKSASGTARCGISVGR